MSPIKGGQLGFNVFPFFLRACARDIMFISRHWRSDGPYLSDTGLCCIQNHAESPGESAVFTRSNIRHEKAAKMADNQSQARERVS